MSRVASLAVLAAVLAPAAARAQAAAPPDSLDPTRWGVVHDVPGTRAVERIADVHYATVGGHRLLADLYRPASMRPGERRAAVVFVNAVGDDLDSRDRVRRWEIYTSWPRLVAAHGMVGVSMDAHRDSIQASLRALFRFLEDRGGGHGIDGARVGIYAASANASGAAELLLGETPPAGVKAAVLYYGGVPAQRPRADLPVLFLVAEGDVPRMGESLAALWGRVIEARAPWTLTFASRMPHGFDAFSDDDEARRLVRQTLGFWSAHLEPLPARREPPSEARAIVAALYGSDAARSAELLERWTATHPRDAEAFRHYARTLVQLRRYDAADSAYSRAWALDSTHVGLLSSLGQMRVGQQRWNEATELLTRAIAGGVRHSLIWGQLAYAQLRLGRYADAARSYERAFEAGIPPGRSTRGVAYYNLACAYARLGERDRAFGALESAVAEGVNDRAALEADEDLASLRADARFGRLLARLAG